MDARKSAGIFGAEAAAAVTLSRRGFHVNSGRVLHDAVVNLVLDRVDELDVADRTFHLADHSGNPFVAFAAQTNRPLYRSPLARPALPIPDLPWKDSR